jgi:hypothetical protein
MGQCVHLRLHHGRRTGARGRSDPELTERPPSGACPLRSTDNSPPPAQTLYSARKPRSTTLRSWRTYSSLTWFGFLFSMRTYHPASTAEIFDEAGSAGAIAWDGASETRLTLRLAIRPDNSHGGVHECLTDHGPITRCTSASAPLQAIPSSARSASRARDRAATAVSSGSHTSTSVSLAAATELCVGWR